MPDIQTGLQVILGVFENAAAGISAVSVCHVH